MTAEFDNLTDNLDSAIFSGDCLVHKENQDALRHFLARWKRELDSHVRFCWDANEYPIEYHFHNGGIAVQYGNRFHHPMQTKLYKIT
jgi:hypothetical protein